MTKPIFEQRIVLAILAFSALGAVAACSAGAQDPTGAAARAKAVAGAGTMEAQSVSLPEGFPETITFPAGSQIVSASGGQPPEYASRTYQIEGQVSDSVESVAAFFTAMIESNGYDIVEVEKGNATLIRFDTIGLDDASVMVMDMYGDGTSTFSMSLIMDPEPE